MNRSDVVIIGSGLGGLLCGRILSREGFGVTVLEKEPQPGGNLLSFSRRKVRFDTGVHYIGAVAPGQTLYRYWNWLGLMDRIRLQPLDPDGFERIRFGNEEFRFAQGFGNFREQLLQRYPGEETALDEYIRTVCEVAEAFPLYNLKLSTRQNKHRFMALGIQPYLSGLPQRTRPGHGIPLASVLAGNNYLYGGSSRTPLSSAALIQHSFLAGACRIVGGSHQVAESLTGMIRSAGGSVRTGLEVNSIRSGPEGFVVQTRAGEEFVAQKVISGIHPAITLEMMNDDRIRPAYRDRIASLENTAAPFILFLTLKPGSFPYFNYNLHYHASSDPWDESGAASERWPAMFLASAGCDAPDATFARSVTLLTYLPWQEVSAWGTTLRGKRGEEYRAFKEERATRLLDLADRHLPGIKQAVDHAEAATPLTYRDYTGIPEGSLYGIRKDYLHPDLTTVLPRTKIPGFFFTGQNTNLHGVVGVTIGAVATCGEILGYEYLMNKIEHD